MYQRPALVERALSYLSELLRSGKIDEPGACKCILAYLTQLAIARYNHLLQIFPAIKRFVVYCFDACRQNDLRYHSLRKPILPDRRYSFCEFDGLETRVTLKRIFYHLENPHTGAHSLDRTFLEAVCSKFF